VNALTRVPGKKYDFRKTARWLHTRKAILARDGNVCHYCGLWANTVDHVIPAARGGDWYDPTNLVVACARCNGRRSGQMEKRRHRRSVYRTVLQSLPPDIPSAAARSTHEEPRHPTLTGDWGRRTVYGRRG
jgi:hypothetical protein